jgi:hypothetical protein
MKIFFITIISIIILSGCGKKSYPKYQGEFNQQFKIKS